MVGAWETLEVNTTTVVLQNTKTQIWELPEIEKAEGFFSLEVRLDNGV
jgi:hypothetical protein